MQTFIHTYIYTTFFSQIWTKSAAIRNVKLLLMLVVFSVGFGVPLSSQAQVTLSGTLYTDRTATFPVATAETVRVAVGTSTPTVFATTSSVTTGAWTVTIPAGHGIGTSTPILVWIDNDPLVRGQVLTKASSSQSVQSITGLDIYLDRAIVRHEGTSGTSTTLTDFSFYTSAQDSDVLHSTSTGLLTIVPGIALYVWENKKFQPNASVMIGGSASATSTNGNFYIGDNAEYSAGGTMTLRGSLRVNGNALYTHNGFSTIFTATSTGATINANVASLGNVKFDGAGGEWEFVTSATTSSLTILKGTVIAPVTTLAITGILQNDATFSHNGGTVYITGPQSSALADIVPYVTGLDVGGGTATGTFNFNVNGAAIMGNALYLVKNPSGTACSAAINTANAAACELMVFNISSTSAPVFLTGRDANGDIGGSGNLAMNAVVATSGRLIIGKAGNGGGCANTGAGAGGCELMIYDISSTTDPIYRSGRDSAGAAGAASENTTALAAITVLGSTTVYMGKSGSATNCVQTVGSSQGCELMVFDVSSTTNPLFRAGRDVSGSTTGTSTLAITQLKVYGDKLFVTKVGSSTACSQTSSFANGCELMVFDISSTTNPLYVAGRDATGSATGTASSTILSMEIWGDKLYVGQFGSTTACVQVEGSAIGCEIIVFDISSTTNPTFVQGLDVAGSYTGLSNVGITSLYAQNNYLYAGKAGIAVPCEQGVGLSLGCELVVFDISSSTAVRMLSSKDIGGNSTGTQSLGALFVIGTGTSLYVAKAGSATLCSSTPGSAIGCEVLTFDTARGGQGMVLDGMTGASALNHVIASGTVEFRASASTTDFTIAVGTTTAPAMLTVAGDYTNSANFIANNGAIVLSSSSAQTLSGNLTDANSFYQLMFSGGGTKTIQRNASTTFFTADASAVVALPDQLTVSDTFTNAGTLITATGTIHTNGYLNEFTAGVSAGGSLTDAQGLGFTALTQVGNTLYAGKAGSATTCSQVAGGAVGCELLVFDVSSTTNPILVNSRDVSGSSNGTGNIQINKFAVSSDNQVLYVAKAGSATACNPTSGNAAHCEIIVFDISSTTNPIFRNGIDSAGSNASTSAIAVVDVLVDGARLFVAKAGNSAPCTQVAGTAAGCELMVFSLSSTTNPVYVAGRDSDGNAAGVTATAATFMAVSSTTLYLAKAAAGAIACTTQANCELAVFNVSSTTNPIYTTGRDVSGSAAGTGNSAINSLSVNGTTLYAGKAGSATLCQGTAGNALGCELIVFDISSTTNPNFLTGRDVSAANTATGTGNVNINYVLASNTQLYIAKAGNITDCSQVAGAAVGCELLVFDVSSTSNPLYMKGTDSDTKPNGVTATATQALALNNNSLIVARALDITPCQQGAGLRTGCELLFLNAPTTFGGILTGTGGLATVTTNGVTRFTAAASTTNVVVATSSTLVAPTSTLSVSGNLTLAGVFRHNQGNVALNGTNQNVRANATTTFYDLTNIVTAAATTTFSTTSPFIILRNLTMRGASYDAPLRLRSASTTAQWKIDPQSTTTISFAYVDVQDSNNVSVATTTLVCPFTCIDSGNNTNWSFSEYVWNASDWTDYDTITISEANIDSDLTDFPVYVDLADLSSQFWSTVSDGGADIRVTTETDVEVPLEVVFASTTLQQGELHFKAPTISSTTDTVFKIWYNGMPDIGYRRNGTYGAQNVWSNNFLAVYHLNEDPGTAGPNGILDSTASGLHGTASGTMSTSDKVTGKAGYAIDFDGTDDLINMSVKTAFQTGDGAVSVWYRPDNTTGGGSETVWSYTDRAIADGNIYMQVRNQADATNGRKPRLWSYDTASALYTTSRVATSTWYHSVTTFNNSNLQEIYHNGQLENSRVSNDAMTQPLAAFGIGAEGTSATPPNDYFQGPIDEVRISSTTRTAAWIKAEYYNQGTTTDFYSVLSSVVTGSSTLANHTLGQVPNGFDANAKTNASLFAFKLTPNSGHATVTAMLFDVSGVKDAPALFSNMRLLRDIDSDGLYDVSDVQVSTVTVTIAGNVGSITVDSDFAATTSADYIIVGDWASPAAGATMRITLETAAIAMFDSNPTYELFGSVTPIQHNRNNKGGGGGGASVGGQAPAGDGDRGGGGAQGGELIGSHPDFFWPSAQSGSWNSPGNAYDQTDGTYATTSSANNQSYTNHGFSVPTINTISGIEVKLELSGSTAAGLVGVELSWNGGANYTSVKNTPTLGTSDAVYTLGSPSDLWGRSWTATEFTNGNFAVRLSGNPSSNTIRLDAIQVRVYHVSGGGGSGGGGSGGGIE